MLYKEILDSIDITICCRVGIGSLSITAMSNVIKSLKNKTPANSYIKAADVWLWSCQIFVFFIFLEFGVVNFLDRAFREWKRKDNSKVITTSIPVAPKCLLLTVNINSRLKKLYFHR